MRSRAAEPRPGQAILATGATVDGQTTARYPTGRLADCGVTVTRPVEGMPEDGELDCLDDGTPVAALKARRPF